MAPPYVFLQLTAAEKHERRLALDQHAGYAQLSALVPIAIFLVVRFSRWVVDRISAGKLAYNSVPGSPQAKYRRENGSSSWAATRRRVIWWLGGDVVFAGQSWGRRDTVIFGVAWTIWLLFLCVHGTGRGEFEFVPQNYLSSP